MSTKVLWQLTYQLQTEDSLSILPGFSVHGILQARVALGKFIPRYSFCCNDEWD